MKTTEKKTYSTPSVIVVRIGVHQFLAASTLDPQETNPTVTVSNETLENDYFSARGFDFDED